MAIRFRKCFSTTNEEQPSTFWKKERDDFEIVPRKPPPSPLIVGLRVFHLRRSRSVKSLFGVAYYAYAILFTARIAQRADAPKNEVTASSVSGALRKYPNKLPNRWAKKENKYVKRLDRAQLPARDKRPPTPTTGYLTTGARAIKAYRAYFGPSGKYRRRYRNPTRLMALLLRRFFYKSISLRAMETETRPRASNTHT